MSRNARPGFSSKAFTLLEIVIAIVIVGILASLAIVVYVQQLDRAKVAEASAHAGVIRRSEQIRKAVTDEYVPAKNTEEINEVLGLNLKPQYYDFEIVGVTEDDFIVLAKLIGKKLENLSGSSDLKAPVLIAYNKDGVMKTGYQQYVTADAGEEAVTGSGAGGSSGGGSGSGSSGGGGAGGSGGGSGGGGSGGGGSSGGSGTGGGSGGGGTTYTSATTANYPSGGGWAEVRNEGDGNLWISDGLIAAYELLEGTESADYAYDLIDYMDISVVALSEAGEYIQSIFRDAAAMFIDLFNVIVVDDTSGFPDQAIAALIAHEATHADYFFNKDEWTAKTLASYPNATIPLSNNSINQEYDCFCNQMKTWLELRGETRDTNNDAWLSWYAQGESALKNNIRDVYAEQKLPEF